MGGSLWHAWGLPRLPGKPMQIAFHLSPPSVCVCVCVCVCFFPFLSLSFTGDRTHKCTKRNLFRQASQASKKRWGRTHKGPHGCDTEQSHTPSSDLISKAGSSLRLGRRLQQLPGEQKVDFYGFARRGPAVATGELSSLPGRIPRGTGGLEGGQQPIPNTGKAQN
uniref:Uncharacterized protein n=1 Tax=Myotis myotis TaxID=51298 RepID=A0A7J7QVH3_MYOMY|nr:hypothetical protein mMyoMyo1_011545 [Myotis myotis]